jgi:aspartyl-tRNA(Asn)/glutamyl-tRNA(Gln) amidotransferase subunit C
MKLSKKEVEKIAQLSRLELTEKEKTQFANQLSDVLDYFEKLKVVNTENVEITAQVTGLENIYRDDEVNQCDIQSDLVKQAADNEDDLIKTKSVF